MNYQLIKQIVEQKEITLKTLCDEVGISDAGLHQMIRNKSMKIEILENISFFLEVPIAVFFEDQQTGAGVNYSGSMDNAKIFHNNIGGKIDFSKKGGSKSIKKTIEVLNEKLAETNNQLQEYKSKCESEQLKNNNSEKIKLTYWNMCTYMVDFVTTLFVKVVEWDESFKDRLIKEPEMRRFKNQINTLQGLSDQKVYVNEKFTEYFGNPII